MNEITKDERISKEIERLNEHFSKIDERQRMMAASLIQNAAFMKITLEDLQTEIKNSGLIEEYQNGKGQRGIKQSAALQGYNALVKNYTAVIKALVQILHQAGPSSGTPIGEKLAAILRDADDEE